MCKTNCNVFLWNLSHAWYLLILAKKLKRMFPNSLERRKMKLSQQDCSFFNFWALLIPASFATAVLLHTHDNMHTHWSDLYKIMLLVVFLFSPSIGQATKILLFCTLEPVSNGGEKLISTLNIMNWNYNSIGPLTSF